MSYTMLLEPAVEGGYIARVKEFDGCIAHGKTQIEALTALEVIQSAWVDLRKKAGMSIPLPEGPCYVCKCLECGAEIFSSVVVHHFSVEHANVDYERGAAEFQPFDGAD